MGRKAPTAEQKHAAAERRARFSELAKRVADMSDDARAALVAQAGALVTVEGRTLTVHNSCLLLTQLPTASMVGGFRQWQAQKRSVRKGARGLMLWVPTGTGKSGERVPAAPGATEAGEDKGKRSGFVMGTVFDVSQTEPTTDRGAPTDGAEGRAEPPAPRGCRQCGCTGDDPARCDLCGAALVPC